jgi:hypothetical protein
MYIKSAVTPFIKKSLFKPGIHFQAEALTVEEKSVIVHCTVNKRTVIRIWPTTFLIQEDGERKKFLQAYNITGHPVWKMVYPGPIFTLVFEGLGQTCRVFDLLEDMPEAGGFRIKGINRNGIDVYQVSIEE